MLIHDWLHDWRDHAAAITDEAFVFWIPDHGQIVVEDLLTALDATEPD